MVDHIEVIVEEPSMEAALRILLPKLLGRITFEIYPHQGKDELLRRLPDRLRAYRSILANASATRLLIVVDRDDEACEVLKDRLERIATDPGLSIKSAASGPPWQVAFRIAIEGLEAWYFGDREAVRASYPRAPATIPNQAAFRDFDAIAGGPWEAFERVMKKVGYFEGGLRKIEAARMISPHLDRSRSRSRSFRAFCDLVHDLTSDA